MQTLVHMKDPMQRWDVVRYLTASALVIYFRVTKLADFKEAMVSLVEFERLLSDEKEWLGLADEPWEKMMGWPRTRAEAQEYTLRLGSELGLSTNHPSRLAAAPPLLTKAEIEELRKYPGGFMSLVLQTWCLQAARDSGAFPGPWYNVLQGSVFKLRFAAYRLRAQLNMPVPLPYFHSLNMLQNINYALYTYAMLSFESNLTPIVLVTIIILTVGMREVAAALSNPFGDDDVDFPVNKWIAQLRSLAIVVHPQNVPCQRPKNGESASNSTTDGVEPVLANLMASS